MPADREKKAQDSRVKTILEEIHPEFVELGAKTIRPADVDRVVESRDEILAALRGSPVLERHVKDAETMLDLIRDYSNGNYLETTYWTVAVATFTLLYVLKPIDIIPDSLPVIGHLDDAIVATHGLDIVGDELGAYRKRLPST